MTAIEVLINVAGSLGWYLFPVNQNTDTPILPKWPEIASNDPNQIQEWFKQYKRCNWAVCAGTRSGNFTVDVDHKKNGIASVERLEAEGYKFSPTLAVQTAHNGYHLHYKYPCNLPASVKIKNTRSELAEGIDIRGEHGMVFIPPSVRDGKPYLFLPPPNPENPIADAPQWLLDRVLDRTEPKSSPDIAANFGQTSPFFSSSLSWVANAPTEAERTYARKALRDEFNRLADMKKGEGRNDAANTAAHSMGTMVGSGWIDGETAEQVLLAALYLNGYVRQDGHEAAKATVRSGLTAGMQKPRARL